MNRVFSQIVLLSVLTFGGLTACQPKTEYLQPLPDVETEQSIRRQAIWESIHEMSIFTAKENSFNSSIAGIVPAEFSHIALEFSQETIATQKFFRASLFTLTPQFVESIEIGCDGFVRIIDESHKTQAVPFQKFLYGEKWRPKNLKICGKLEVPSYFKLMIHPTELLILENAEIIVAETALMSLRVPKVEIIGQPLRLNYQPSSIVLLTFEEKN